MFMGQRLSEAIDIYMFTVDGCI